MFFWGYVSTLNVLLTQIADAIMAEAEKNLGVDVLIRLPVFKPRPETRTAEEGRKDREDTNDEFGV